MLDRNLRFVVFRYSHHSPHSGYSRVAEYGTKLFNSETIRTEKPLSRKLIRERMLWKISAGTPGYTRTSMAVELKTVQRMLSERDSIFHFLYGETTYHYAGLLNHKRNNHVVATFHLPPVGLEFVKQFILIGTSNNFRRLYAWETISVSTLNRSSGLTAYSLLHLVLHTIISSRQNRLKAGTQICA